MNRKIHAGVAAFFVAAGLLLTATGCSQGASAPAGDAKPAASDAKPKAAKAAPKTYTAADVTSIVTAAKTQLGLSGEVQNFTPDQLQSSSGGSVLSQFDPTYSPAQCGDEVKNSIVPPSGLVGSSVSSDTTDLIVLTVDGKQLPDALRSSGTSKLDKFLADCPNVTVSISLDGATVSYGMTVKKADVSTNADSTIAVEETTSIPGSDGVAGQDITETIVAAYAGNLFIEVSAPSAGTATATPAASPADLINAVVAAAKE
jgi:hypothetical protein